MLRNLVIVSVIWPWPSKYNVFLSSCEPHWSKCLVVFSPWQSTMRINVLFKKIWYLLRRVIYYIEKKDVNICIYTVHSFLYECITCKVKSCLSNYCTYFLRYHNNRKLPQNNIQEKNYSWWTSCRSCWSGQRFSSTSHLMFSIAMHRGRNLLEWHTHPLDWSAVMSSHTAVMTSNRDVWSCDTFHLHSQKMVVIVLSMIVNLHIYAPKLDWLNSWFKLYCN